MSFVCSVCGQTHEELAAWAYKYPDPWLGLSTDEQAHGHCSSDLCRTPAGDFFIRGVLRMPLVGGIEDTFEFGVWCSLSRANFDRYVATFDDQDQSKLGQMFGWLSNELSGFVDTFALKTNVHPQDNGQRPLIELQPTDHPLAAAQRDGISMDKVFRIIHSQDEASLRDRSA